MDWIERNRRLLQASSAVCAILAAAIVLWFNLSPRREFNITRMQLGFIVLPWLVGFAAFTPLLWLDSAKGGRSTTEKVATRAVIAFVSAAGVVIFAGVYAHFVFRLF